MKELINNMIFQAEMSNAEFAKRVGLSPTNLSQKKLVKKINIELLSKWAKIVNIKKASGITVFGIIELRFFLED